MKIILHHPKSGAYMYCSSEDERDALLADSAEIFDVTGNADHEAAAEAALGPYDPGMNERREAEAEAEAYAPAETICDWAFTFGFGSPNANRFVRFHNCTFTQARTAMEAKFGRQWAFQYTWKDFEPQIGRYGLSELTVLNGLGGD